MFKNPRLLGLSLLFTLALAAESALPTPKAQAEIRYPVTRTDDGVLHAGPATLVEHEGLKLIHVFGTREEMARQHAAFARGKIESLALNHFIGGLRQMIEANQTGLRRAIPIFALDHYFYPMLKRGLTAEEKAMIAAFEDEAGMKKGQMMDAYVYPDLGEILMAQLWGSERAAVSGLGGFGCTSFVLNPTQTSEDGLIHARNLDFHGEGAFERNGAFVYFHPSEPGILSYASVTTLGVHVAGPTAYNEAGITVDLHQLTSTETSVTGRPVLLLMEDVMRNARTLSEAIEFLRVSKFTSPWKINVSSAREGRFAMIEASADRFEAHELTGAGLFATNHALFEGSKQNQFFPGFRYAEDSKLREDNIKAIVRGALAGGVSAQEALDALGSGDSLNGNGQWESRTMHGIVSRMDSVSAVVFVPGREVAYVAVPRMDFGKANEGRFIAVPMSFATDADHTSRSLLRSMPDALLPAHGPSDSRALAHAHYRRAYAEYATVNDHANVLKELEEAAALEPSESIYPLMSAITKLRMAGMLARDGRPAATPNAQLAGLAEARTALEKVLAMELTGYHESLVRLLLAEISIARGTHARAQELLEKVDGSYSTILATELKKARSAASSRRGTGSIAKFANLGVDYVSGDITKF
jgi:hypothetical protein